MFCKVVTEFCHAGFQQKAKKVSSPRLSTIRIMVFASPIIDLEVCDIHEIRTKCYE